MSNLRPIMLVEDDPRDLELTMIALERSRLANEVIITRDGVEALAYLRRTGEWDGREPGHPAVVLLDIQLPRMGGLEVLEAIKGDKELRRIPVVMVTSSREEPDLERSYELGVNAYVVKPVSFNDFLKAVQDLGCFWAVLNEPPPSLLRPSQE